MILHRILLLAVKRHTQEFVNPIGFKHGELAGSMGGWVYQARTVASCRAPREKRGSSSTATARRACLLPDQALELPFHARDTRCVVAIASGLCEGKGSEGMVALMICHRILLEAVKRPTQ